ncbi:MAG: hypothetical protein HY675_03055 [Chloroflexi bacterium]|nr:hypothetical protein [Chloroflexota bacterium]
MVVLAPWLLAPACSCDSSDHSEVDDGGEPCNPATARVIAIDWSRTRLGAIPPEVERARRMQKLSRCHEEDSGDADTPDAAPPPSHKLDWNWTTNDPVNSTPALVMKNWPNQDATDQLFACTTGTSGTSFYALDNLYAANPNVAWSKSIGGCAGSAVGVWIDGTRVVALSQDGKLWCWNAANGNRCGGWSADSYNLPGGRTVSRSSPYVPVGYFVYFGDSGGYLNKVDTRTGTLVWEVELDTFLPAPCTSGCNNFPIEGSPVVTGGFIYVGTDAGAAFRVVDTTVTPVSGDIAVDWLCPTPNSPGGCSPQFTVFNAPAVDVFGHKVFFFVGGRMFDYPEDGSPWNDTFQKDAGFGGEKAYSSPVVELFSLTLHVGYANRLLRIPYPMSGTSSVFATKAYSAGPDSTYPRSTPVVFAGNVYMGTGAGFAERFGCLTPFRGPALNGVSSDYGTAIDGGVVIDYATGNAIFGYTNGATGGLVQITQRQTWGCQNYKFWGGLGCGVGECKPSDPQNWVVHDGNTTACALKGDDGTVWCWGDNTYGQLGDGSTVDSYIAMKIPDLKDDVTQVQANSTACAVRGNGSVWCWGDADDGEIGDGTTSPGTRSNPVQVSNTNLTNAVSVAVGTNFTCARKSDDTVWCWGKNNAGQLGAGDTVQSSTPRQVTGLTSAIQIDTYTDGACAVRSNNTVWCWGANVYGQVGNNSTTNPVASARQVTGLSSIDSVSGGNFHNCAVRSSDSTVWCWGKNESGQLGINNTVSPKSSALQTTNASSITQVTAGGNHSCARDSSGQIFCWGDNAEGQLGDNTTVRKTTAKQIGSGTDWEAITVGTKTTCAVRTNSTVWCWGDGANKTIGLDDTTTDQTSPSLGPVGNIIQADEGASGGCAVTQAGLPYCWGGNARGELGDGTTSDSAKATAMTGLTSVGQVSRGGLHACALKVNDPGDDTVWCWGKDDTGQVGDGANTADKTSAVQVIGLTGNFVGVSAATGHSCFLKGDGTVWCVGDNTNGALGDNSTITKHSPVQTAGLTDIVQISTSGSTSCALRGDSSVFCWGANGSGQVGDGTTVNRVSAQPVPLNGVLQVSTAGETTCALKYDGTLWCWGANGSGQVGDNTSTTPRFPPTPVAGISDAAYLGEGGWLASATAHGRCAIRGDGSQWCWGNNVYGQVAEGSTVSPRLSAVETSYSGATRFPVGFETTSAGALSHCAVRGDGRVWCWGKNDVYQIGDITTVLRTTPTRTRNL